MNGIEPEQFEVDEIDSSPSAVSANDLFLKHASPSQDERPASGWADR